MHVKGTKQGSTNQLSMLKSPADNNIKSDLLKDVTWDLAALRLCDVIVTCPGARGL